MTSVSTASKWPARAAYLAGAVFVAASGGVNIQFGWSKGTDPITSAMWACVAGAVAIVFALSWPALIRSLECCRWAAAAMALAALLLSGAYSMSAALGSAAGGRMHAADSEAATKSTQKRAQKAYDDATVALGKLAPSRLAPELDALLLAARKNPEAYGCRRINSLLINCPRLEAEMGRANERKRLQTALDTASAHPPPHRPRHPTAMQQRSGATCWPWVWT